VNCYAEQVAASTKMSAPGKPYAGLTDKNGRWNGKIAFVEHHLLDPLRWQTPKKIFVNSMSDLFHENLPFEQIDRIFAVMALADHHVFQVLTKRPARMLDVMSELTRRQIAAGSRRRIAPKQSSPKGSGTLRSGRARPGRCRTSGWA
jgi:protein gp37